MISSVLFGSYLNKQYLRQYRIIYSLQYYETDFTDSSDFTDSTDFTNLTDPKCFIEFPNFYILHRQT